MQQRRFELSSAALHVIAMMFMLYDHMWGTILPRYSILTCIGRIAYPIYAFMLVEGYFHTHDVKKYLKRLLLWGLISEIPFDLMMGGVMFYPFHQNAMFTMALGLLLVWWVDISMQKSKTVGIVVSCVAFLLGLVIGNITMVDYFGPGIAMILVFYVCRGERWYHKVTMFAFMYWLNVVVAGGMYYPVTIFGHEFELMQQGLALLALIPIWMYHGKQGYHAKWFSTFCYVFYPAHMLFLVLLARIL